MTQIQVLSFITTSNKTFKVSLSRVCFYIFCLASSAITRLAHSIVRKSLLVHSFLTSRFCGYSAPLNRHCNNRLLPLHLRSRCGGADRSRGHPSSKISPYHTCHRGPFDGASSASHFYTRRIKMRIICVPLLSAFTDFQLS